VIRFVVTGGILTRRPKRLLRCLLVEVSCQIKEQTENWRKEGVNKKSRIIRRDTAGLKVEEWERSKNVSWSKQVVVDIESSDVAI